MHDDLGVVDEAVDECGDRDGVAEYLGPGGERLVRGDDEAASFVAGLDECEQECCGVGIEGDVADLVGDDQPDACQPSEFGLETSGASCGSEPGDPFVGGREQDAVSTACSLDAGCDGQVGLAGAGWSEKLIHPESDGGLVWPGFR